MTKRQHITRLTFVAAVALLAVTDLRGAAPTESTPPLTTTVLVAASDVILTGRVSDLASGWDAETIYSYITLDVGEVLKGWVPERQVIIKQLGGRAGDMALAIEGQASFARGEDVLVFLSVRPRDHTLATVALSQGKWTVATVGPDGNWIARRPAPHAGELRPFGRQVATVRRNAVYALIGPRSTNALADATRLEINVRPRDAAASIPIAAIDAGGLDASNATGDDLRAAPIDTDRDCFTRFKADGATLITLHDPCGELSPSAGGVTVTGAWVQTAPGGGSTAVQILRRGVLSNQGETARTAPVRLSSASAPRLAATGALATVAPLVGRFERAAATIPSAVQTTRINVATDGTQANDVSRDPDISADGRFVVFVSYAANLAAGAVAGQPNIFLRDTQSNQTTLVAARSDGPQITPDGRYISYRGGDPIVRGHSAPLRVLDRQTGATTLLASAGSISDDFRYVASWAPGPDSCGVVSILDRQTGQTTVVNQGTSAVLSGDGKLVAYTDYPAETCPYFRRGEAAYLTDVATRAFVRLPVDPRSPNDIPTPQRIRANRYVISTVGSLATVVFDRVTGGTPVVGILDGSVSTNGRYIGYATRDVYVADLETGARLRVSTPPAGGAANGSSSNSAIDDRGRTVYRSTATNLVDGDTNGVGDLFLTVGGIDADLPTEPNGLIAVVSFPGGVPIVDLSWTPPVSGGAPTGYLIEAGSVSGGSDLARFSNGLATSLRAPVPVGQTIFVRVRAVSGAGASVASNEVSFRAGSGVAPGPPTLLQVAGTGQGRATLIWAAPVSGDRPLTYIIEAGSAPGASDLAVVFTRTSETVIAGAAPDRDPGSPYFVRVRAANAAGVGPPSNDVSFSTTSFVNSCFPGALPPTSLTGSVSGSTVTLQFIPSILATSLVVQMGTVAGASDVASLDVGLAAPLTFDAVPRGTLYIRLRGLRRCGLSGPSNEIVVTVN